MNKEIKTFNSTNKFIEWVYNNRYNKEVNDDVFCGIIELNCIEFKTNTGLDQKKVDYFTNCCKSTAIEIIKELIAGNKLMAVKIYKNESGLGLKESKEFIDGYCIKYMDK